MGVFDGIDDDMILQTVDNMDEQERDTFISGLEEADKLRLDQARAKQLQRAELVNQNVDEDEMAEYGQEQEGDASGYGSAAYTPPGEAEQNPSLMSEDGMIILDGPYTFAIDPYDKIYLYEGQDYRGMLPAPSGREAGDPGSLVVSGGALGQFEIPSRTAGDERDKGKERVYGYDREALRAEDAKARVDEEEAGESEREDTTGLLVDGIGDVLDGTYRFDVRRNGWLSLSKDGGDAGVMPDPVGFELNAFGSVRINRGVPETPKEYRGEYGQQARQGITEADLTERNVSVFSAMFAEGAGEAQRSVRIVANGEHIMLKNIREAAGGESLPGNGPQTSGTVTFTRHRTRENELVIEGGVDVAFVRTQLRALLDNPAVAYPYRDRRRVKIH